MTVKDYRLTKDEADEIFDALTPYGLNPRGRTRFIENVTKNSSTDIYLDSGYSFTISFQPTGYFAELAEANAFSGDSLETQKLVNSRLNVMFRKFEF